MGANELRDKLLGFERHVWRVEIGGATFGLLEPTAIVFNEYADQNAGATGNVQSLRSMGWLLARCLCDPETRQPLFPTDGGEQRLIESIPVDVLNSLWRALLAGIKERTTDLGKGPAATEPSSSG